MVLIFIYLFVALGISFLCSILEAVLLSTPMSYITIKSNEGSKNALLLKKLKTNIDAPISAILSLNTVAHTIGAAGVGAQAVKVFGEIYFGLISAILTILILIFSEIIPKTIGATYWKKLCLSSAGVIQFMIWVCYPLVWLSEFITKIISKNGDDSSISREEICAIADVGTQEGILQIKETKVIQNIIRLDSIKIKEVMTPRVVTIIADENETLKEFFDDKSFRPYSRIPVYDKEKDYITGYILSKDVLEKLSEGKNALMLSDIKRMIMQVSEDDTVASVWEKMLENKDHIVSVENSYGSFQGIATMEDVVETILGLEIIDEKDTVADMQQLARDKWRARMDKYKQLVTKVNE